MNKQAAASGRICQVSKSKLIKKLHPLQFPLLKAKVFFYCCFFQSFMEIFKVSAQILKSDILQNEDKSCKYE